MVSIAAVSDCHLGYRHKFKTERLRDYLAAFSDAVKKIVAQRPDILIIGGDLLHHPKPDPVSMRSAVEKLLYLANQFPVVMCIGNHEIQGHLGTTYTPLYSSLHKNIHVLTTDTPTAEFKIGQEKVTVHGFQFLRGKAQAEDALIEISKGVGFGTNILCIHQAIEGYLEPHEISMRVMHEIEGKYDLIVSGHVHKHQKIDKLETPAYYIGSTERVSFNEAENPAGYMFFKNLKYPPEFVEVKSAPMRVIKAKSKPESVEELRKQVRELIEKNRDVELLKVNVEADISADILDLNPDYADLADEFKVLEVNVKPRDLDEIIELDNITLNTELIREYFEKTGVTDNALIGKCVELYERYSDE